MEVINVCAPSFDEADSYGQIGAQLVMQLSAKSVHVNPYALCPLEHGVQSAELKKLLTKPTRRADTSIVLGYPTNAAKFPPSTRRGRRIALSMFESSRIMPTWPPIFDTMQAVIVPSKFCYQVFRDCGVTAPIHVVPLGISPVFRPAPRPPDRPLTFLAFLDRGARKGGLVALQAFLMAFGDDTNYRLILKGRTPKQAVKLLNANAEIIQRDMSEAELHELYLSADILINPHRGEGWGMIPRQAAACGCLALTTAWSGTADDLEHWGNPIPYKLVPADWAGNATLAGQDLGMWAEPCIDSLVELMKKVACEREIYQARARRAAAWVAQHYTWAGFAERVLEVWRDT